MNIFFSIVECVVAVVLYELKVPLLFSLVAWSSWKRHLTSSEIIFFFPKNWSVVFIKQQPFFICIHLIKLVICNKGQFWLHQKCFVTIDWLLSLYAFVFFLFFFHSFMLPFGRGFIIALPYCFCTFLIFLKLFFCIQAHLFLSFLFHK